MNDDKTIQDDGELSQLDRYLRALQDEQRRRILYSLEDHHVTSLEELTRYSAAQGTGQSPSELSEDEYESLQIELHHSHLPRLEDYGLIDYDERNKDVRLAESSRTFSLLLQFLRFVESQS